MNISNISKYEIAMYKLYETSDRAISGAMVRARAYMYDRALSMCAGKIEGARGEGSGDEEEAGPGEAEGCGDCKGAGGEREAGGASETGGNEAAGGAAAPRSIYGSIEAVKDLFDAPGMNFLIVCIERVAFHWLR